MANPCLLHLPLRSNLNGRDRAGVVTASSNGPVRFTADGYYAEEATTNYVLNPRAAVDTSNVALGGTGATMTRVAGTDSAIDSEYVYRVQTTATDTTEVLSVAVNNYLAAASPLASDTAVTISFDVVINAATKFIPAIQWNFGPTTPLTERIGDFTLEVARRYSLTGTIPAGTTVTGLRLLIYTRTGGTGGAARFDVSNMQFEAKAYATSYADGSMGTGYSWAGTAHASASSRAIAYLSLPSAASAYGITPNSGAVALRGKRVLVTGTVDGKYASPISMGGSEVGRDYLLMFFSPDTDAESYRRLYAQWQSSGGAAAYTSKSGAMDVNVAELFYTGWLGTTTELAELGDSSVVTGTKPAASGTFDGAGADLYIGGPSTPTTFGGSISDVMIFDRPLSAQERNILAATPRWSFNTLSDQFARIKSGLMLPV